MTNLADGKALIRSFDDLVGHDAVLTALGEAFRSQRAHHAYLFTGPPGIGKCMTARLLAQSILCRQGAIGRPCHTCSDCLRIEAGSHPDWLELEPQAPAIKIESIRRLSREWSFRSFAGGNRCVLLDDAQRLTPEAANALLKILEEPPPFSYFFFIAANRSQLLPPIVSRCQHVSFTPLTRFEVETVLTRFGLNSESLGPAALFSSGSPGRALALVEEPAFLRHREFFSDFLSLGQPDARDALDFGGWAEAGESDSRSGGGSLVAQRDHVLSFLALLRFLLRDLCLLKAGGTRDLLLARHLEPLLVDQVEQLTWDHLWDMLEASREAERALEGNVTPRLVLENLALRVMRPEVRPRAAGSPGGSAVLTRNLTDSTTTSQARGRH